MRRASWSRKRLAMRVVVEAAHTTAAAVVLQGVAGVYAVVAGSMRHHKSPQLV